MGAVQEQLAAIEDPKLREIVKVLTSEFEIEMIILFGSRVDGETREHSDYDLLIVAEIGREEVSDVRSSMRVALREVKVPMDLVVVPSDQFETERKMPCSVVRTAWENGEVVYRT